MINYTIVAFVKPFDNNKKINIERNIQSYLDKSAFICIFVPEYYNMT